jgi:hypothetical protein
MYLRLTTAVHLQTRPHSSLLTIYLYDTAGALVNVPYFLTLSLKKIYYIVYNTDGTRKRRQQRKATQTEAEAIPEAERGG